MVAEGGDMLSASTVACPVLPRYPPRYHPRATMINAVIPTRILYSDAKYRNTSAVAKRNSPESRRRFMRITPSDCPRA